MTDTKSLLLCFRREYLFFEYYSSMIQLLFFYLCFWLWVWWWKTKKTKLFCWSFHFVCDQKLNQFLVLLFDLIESVRTMPGLARFQIVDRHRKQSFFFQYYFFYLFACSSKKKTLAIFGRDATRPTSTNIIFLFVRKRFRTSGVCFDFIHFDCFDF